MSQQLLFQEAEIQRQVAFHQVLQLIHQVHPQVQVRPQVQNQVAKNILCI